MEGTIENILDSGDEEWIKAITPPSATKIAYRVFNFLRENRDEAEMVISGMQPYIKGLDKLYLYQVADAQGVLDMRRYDFTIEHYKSKILKEQAKNSKTNES